MDRPVLSLAPDWRVTFSARWLLLVAAAVPFGFVAWVSLLTYRDAPFWDEFRTTLKFLNDLHDSKSLGQSLGLFFAASDQHCMVTSRLIFAGIYFLTGQINFIALAVIGHLSIAVAIVVLAWQPRDVNLRLFFAAVLSLLIFQLQHFENQLLSYAAIDHYQVVMWSIISLVLLHRGQRWATWAAGGAAVAAVFTVAQGLAVFPAGAWLLWQQRRHRALAGWLGLGGLVSAFFVWTVSAAAPAGSVLNSVAGWWAAFRYWITLLGSVPGLEHPLLAPCLGATGLALTLALVWGGNLRREPVLGAFLVCTLVATLLITYGRFSAEVPLIAPRYFVQSALFWATLIVLALEATVERPRFWGYAIPIVLVGGLFSVVASSRYLPVAEKYFRDRLATIRYYDKWLTLAGAPVPVYPDHAEAEQILKASEQRGIFRLQARTSHLIKQQVPRVETAMHYHLDELQLADRRLHVRGWVLPPGKWDDGYRPYLVLRAGGAEFAFRGRRERRPDVAAAHNRPDAINSGFLFVIRRLELPPTELKVSIELRNETGGVFTHTDHRVANQVNFDAASLANVPPTLLTPSRQIFLGVLP